MSQAPTESRIVTNGVDVIRLGQTVAAIEEEPQIAQFKFRAKNKWLDGSVNRTEVEAFDGAGEKRVARPENNVFQNDEPDVLFGRGCDPNPAEFALHALIGCLTTSLAYHAAAQGIDVDCIESKIEGDIDLHGFLGLREEVRPGFNEIRVGMKVRSEADLEKLKTMAGFSPIFDTIRNPVKIVLDLEKA